MLATTPIVSTTALSVTIEAVTAIDAPAEKAWTVLADTGTYAQWNPFVRRLDGPLEAGHRIEVDLQLPDRKLQKMKPKVTGVETSRSFEWLGGFGPRGVFDGRHRFEIRPVGAQRCELVQSEKLSGLLVPLFKKMLTGPTPEAFVALNEAFKARVERAG
ncbi:MAG: SRPBCC family protein [Acidimicrobiales bacterium]